jgi:hypothetical protein
MATRLCCTGRGQSEPAVVRQTGFLGLAEQRRAVLVFPDGEQRSWDAGHGCCGAAGSRRAPDVPFVTAIVAEAVRRWPVDVTRVYLVGYSRRAGRLSRQGHAWPVARAGGGSPTAATLMWAFLSQHDERSRVPHHPS